jgi:hypothetical protein
MISRAVKRSTHAARVRKTKNAFRIFVGNPEGDHQDETDVYGRILIFYNPILFAICTSTFRNFLRMFTIAFRRVLSCAPL